MQTWFSEIISRFPKGEACLSKFGTGCYFSLRLLQSACVNCAGPGRAKGACNASMEPFDECWHIDLWFAQMRIRIISNSAKTHWRIAVVSAGVLAWGKKQFLKQMMMFYKSGPTWTRVNPMIKLKFFCVIRSRTTNKSSGKVSHLCKIPVLRWRTCTCFQREGENQEYPGKTGIFSTCQVLLVRAQIWKEPGTFVLWSRDSPLCLK